MIIFIIPQYYYPLKISNSATFVKEILNKSTQNRSGNFIIPARVSSKFEKKNAT